MAVGDGVRDKNALSFGSILTAQVDVRNEKG